MVFKLYEVSAYDPTDGKIILEPKAITAISVQAARDKAILLLPSGTDVDVVKVNFRPLG